MPVYKFKSGSGIVWYYSFDLAGSGRQGRRRAKASGFATKKEAQDAETARRTDDRWSSQYGWENNCCASSKPMPRLGFALSRLLFRGSKRKRMEWYDCYTILEGGRGSDSSRFVSWYLPISMKLQRLISDRKSTRLK